ncbi:MAG: SDR family NAD(P)-dependent oxidoreductase [Phycisphaerales bacterium]
MAETTNKTAIVTGAGSGIGLAVARMLGAKGYRLMLVGRDRGKLEQACTGLVDPIVFCADLSKSSEAERMIDEGARLLGRIDVLVNNAGWTPLKSVGAHLAEDIEQVFRINAIGPCVAIARLFPILLKQGGGCIVNVSSMATVDPFPGLFAYAAAKASLNLMVKSCVNEGRSSGVRAFAVAPGAVETPLLRSMFPEAALPKSRTLSPERVAEVILDCINGKRENDLGGTILVPSP